MASTLMNYRYRTYDNSLPHLCFSDGKWLPPKSNKKVNEHLPIPDLVHLPIPDLANENSMILGKKLQRKGKYLL